jgi:hypothetical protein
VRDVLSMRGVGLEMRWVILFLYGHIKLSNLKIRGRINDGKDHSRWWIRGES